MKFSNTSCRLQELSSLIISKVQDTAKYFNGVVRKIQQKLIYLCWVIIKMSHSIFYTFLKTCYQRPWTWWASHWGWAETPALTIGPATETSRTANNSHLPARMDTSWNGNKGQSLRMTRKHQSLWENPQDAETLRNALRRRNSPPNWQAAGNFCCRAYGQRWCLCQTSGWSPPGPRSWPRLVPGK